jgi:hypothetical protein
MKGNVMIDDDHAEAPSEERTLSPKSNMDIQQALQIKRDSLTKELNELNSISSRIQEEYTRKLEELQSQKKPLEDALQHVEALLRFEGQYIINGQVDVPASITVQASTNSTPTDAAFDLLTELHQPLHYKELTAKLQERKVFIPGKDPAATLLSRINRDNRFKRAKKRGVYALSSWRMRDMKKKVNKKRKKKKS